MLEVTKTRVSAVMVPDKLELNIRDRLLVLTRIEQKDIDPAKVSPNHGVILVYMAKNQKNWYLCHRFNNTRGWLDEVRKGKTPSVVKAMGSDAREQLVLYMGVVQRTQTSIYNLIGNVKVQLPGSEYSRPRNLNKDDRQAALYRFNPTGEFFVWATLMAPNKTLNARLQMMRYQAKARGSTTNAKMRQFCVTNSDKLSAKNFKLIDAVVVPYAGDMVKEKKALIQRHGIDPEKVMTLIRSGR